ICRPFFYGDWSTPVVVSGTDPILEAELEDVPGDVDAEGEMTVTEVESVARRYCEVGVEQYGYDPDSPSSVILNLASGLSVTGFSGTSSGSGAAGKYSANVAALTASTSVQTICGTSGADHVGTKRVAARVYAVDGSDVQWRMAWRVGDGKFTYGDWIDQPGVALGYDWVQVDFGTVTIEEASAGTQRWEAIFQVRTTTGTEAVEMDYAEVMPAERLIRIRSPRVAPTTIAVAVEDGYTQSAGNATGKSPDVGSAYVGAGDTDDFTIDTTNDRVQRAATSDSAGAGRALTSGPAIVNTFVALTLLPYTTNTDFFRGAIFRYSDISNFAVVGIENAAGVRRLKIRRKLAGSWSNVTSAASALTVTHYGDALRIEIEVYETGEYFVNVYDSAGDLLPPEYADLDFRNSVFASGGGLASGSVGVYDEQSGASAGTRQYDGLAGYAIEPMGAVCFADQSAIISHDRVERYDPTGTFLGEPDNVRGSRLFIPPAGDQSAVTRVVSKLRRRDLVLADDNVVDDEHEMSIRYRPRYRNPIGTT
ncbi:MAG: hypothetical protein KGZ65_06250, partial [Sphingomonadales bacterium]|nr:hypothetical protein [Sphingomonadaceae bacterium]MBS3930821.1 hypothetical protein [Sphingomonadales bacterium]